MKVSVRKQVTVQWRRARAALMNVAMVPTAAIRSAHRPIDNVAQFHNDSLQTTKIEGGG
jgi:hypothetical protein